LFYLFLITCVPFTTIIVGRFPDLAPAVCLYAGTTALIAAVAWKMMTLLPDIEPGRHIEARRFGLGVLFYRRLLGSARASSHPLLLCGHWRSM
jgi:hypothetical protein